jgi:hypothetical protein
MFSACFCCGERNRPFLPVVLFEDEEVFEEGVKRFENVFLERGSRSIASPIGLQPRE